MLFPQNFVALSYSTRSSFGKILLTFKSFLGDLLTSTAQQHMTPQKLLQALPCRILIPEYVQESFLEEKTFFKTYSYLFAIEIGVSSEGRSRAGE